MDIEYYQHKPPFKRRPKLDYRLALGNHCNADCWVDANGVTFYFDVGVIPSEDTENWELDGIVE